MEFKLNKYTNFISKMKEKLVILKNDEIRIKNPSEEYFETINNLDTFNFTNLNLLKLYENQVTITSLQENMYMSTSQESEINSLPNFVNFLNFLRNFEFAPSDLLRFLSIAGFLLLNLLSLSSLRL